MSTATDRARTLLGEVEQVIEQVRASLKASDGSRAAAGVTGYLLKSVTNWPEADAAAAFTAVESAGLLEEWQTMVTVASKIRDALHVSVDTSKGAEMIGRLKGASEWIDDDGLVESIDNVCEMWESLVSQVPTTKSTRGRSTNGAGQPDLGFKVVVTCTLCSKQVASTGKNNLNSLRDACKPHDKANHGDRIASGQPLFGYLTDALKGVMREGKQSVQGGNYIVSRAS